VGALELAQGAEDGGDVEVVGAAIALVVGPRVRRPLRVRSDLLAAASTVVSC